jgi:hypothetical protein
MCTLGNATPLHILAEGNIQLCATNQPNPPDYVKPAGNHPLRECVCSRCQTRIAGWRWGATPTKPRIG